MSCRYDGTFAGLLTLFAHLFSQGEVPEEIREEGEGEPSLFDAEFRLTTDPAVAARFLRAVESRIGRQGARNLCLAHASELPGVAMDLYRYLALGRRLGLRLDAHLTDPAILSVHRAADLTRRETHRLKGFVRFRELDGGLLYAPLEPDHAILPFLAPHFAARLPRESWLIHDLRRGTGVMGQQGRWSIGDIHQEATPHLSDEEPLVRELWKRFFSTVAIPERRNPRLQRQFMPKKYWRHLVEMER